MNSFCNFLGKCFRGETDLDNDGTNDNKQLIALLENYLKERQKITARMRSQNSSKSSDQEKKILTINKNNDNSN